MARWEKVQCHTCGGHGVVATYNFGCYGPDECQSCNGSGQVSVSSGGVIAQWPGGPLLGRLTKQEMAERAEVVADTSDNRRESMLTIRDRIVLALLNDGRMEATARQVGQKLGEHGYCRGGYQAVGTGVLIGLRQRELVMRLPELAAWRIAQRGRDALQINSPATV